MTDFVKQLKEQVNIADVVGEFVRLKKAGSNHMGLCPFHGERTPSFSVSEKKGIYHCFGCQRGGDVISFVQEIQGVSFHEAIRILASKFGIKVPSEFAAKSIGMSGSANSTANSDEKFELYYKLNRFVAQFYHEKLLSPVGAKARQYLYDRGITDATIKSAYLGYAPAEWGALVEFLEEKKAPIAKAEELGLIRKKSTGADTSGRLHYDLFRDRVMFPVVDLRGRVIAFGGRTLGIAGNQTNGLSDGPKYLNSPESPIYKKGSHVYGLFSAQKDMRAEDACVVVEGFMDCVSLQQAGVGHAIATLGTALTSKQVALLKRFSRNIILLYDGDAAGQEAQSKSMEIFLDEDVVARGVSLPDEYDPDEFVKEKGVDALRVLLESAPYLLDQKILQLASESGVHSEARARAVDQILPWLAKISAETPRLVRIQEVASLFGMPFELVDQKVRELQSKSKSVQAPSAKRPDGRPAFAGRRVAPAQPSNLTGGSDPLDLRFIQSLAQYPHLFREITDKDGILDGLETEAARVLVAKLFSDVSSSKSLSVGPEILDSVESAVVRVALRKALLAAEEETEHTPDEQEALVTEMRDFERKLVRRGLERRKESLRAVILKTEGAGQTEEVSRLMEQYKELVKRLDESSLGAVEIGRKQFSPV